MTRRLWIAMIAISVAAPAAAQTNAVTAPDAQLSQILEKLVAGREADGPQDQAREALEKIVAVQKLEQDLVGVMRSKIAVEARITKGAPYSAEAVTESTQTLADGNRILHKTVTRVYRDNDGRTRREQVNDNGAVESIAIVDPVAGTSFVLQPETRTAYRDSALVSYGRGSFVYPSDQAKKESAEMQERAKVEAAAKAARMQDVDKLKAEARAKEQRSPAERVAIERTAAGQTTREDLGQQNIEGVAATGSRTTTTIPAGAIGNLQPIKVVSEQWFSPDLQALVLTKHNDPRSGETTYRLLNIVRAEPDRSLFMVPPDYNLRSSGIRR